jgi:predicted dipeptidase
MTQEEAPIVIGEEALAEVVELTRQLVSFQTVAAIAEPADNEAFLVMSQWLAEWSAEHGLEFHIIGEHDAYEIVLAGSSEAPDRSVVMVGHCDVVPVNDPPAFTEPDFVPQGWDRPPFLAELSEGALWGRGTEDDKGPIAAAMVVLAALAEAGVVPEHDVVIAMGTGEEHSWGGMRRYVAQAPPYEYAISIDAEFPVVVGESGFVAWGLKTPLVGRGEAGERATAVDVHGGLFLTQVPDHATLTVSSATESSEELAERANAAAERIIAALEPDVTERVRFEVTVGPDNSNVTIEAHGQSIHASTPEDGINAFWLLAPLGRELDLAPGGIRTMLDIIEGSFLGDHYGVGLGIAVEDEFMGRLSVAPTKLWVERGQVVLRINLRRPRGQTSEEFRTALRGAVSRLEARYGAPIREAGGIWIGEPHFVDPEGELTRTLMDIFRTSSGQADAAAISVRGSTYARLFSGAVSFGPALPGHPYTGHGSDEHIELEALRLQTEVLMEAVLRLSGVSSSG